jgi:phosphoglycolate phosphatase-like HAD superfamily hydrolase
MIGDVFKFVATFKDFPSRSFPPSFNPANIMESTRDTLKQKKALTESLDLDRIRAGVNKLMIGSSRSPGFDNRPDQCRLACAGQRVIQPRDVQETSSISGGADVPARIVGFSRRLMTAGLIAASLCGLTGHRAFAQTDPLPSWNDGAVKKSITDFVASVTRNGGPDFVSPAERIAVFDNDGTLWCEQPTYVQVAFALDRVRALAPQHPEWKTTQPFAAVLDNDEKLLAEAGDKELIEIIEATHTGMSVEDFSKTVEDWLASARHPHFRQPYTDLVYQPMLELLRYLRANRFKTFIVSGGGVEFMRPWTEKAYGIPPEQVVGSSGVVQFETRPDGTPVLIKQPEVEFVDDGPGKPVGINRFIGRRPIFAFGNSDGDLQMLQWTAAGGARPGGHFVGLVHHTDADREYAYDRQSRVGRLDKALDEAQAKGWAIVDMKNDWNVIFPFQERNERSARRRK